MTPLALSSMTMHSRGDTPISAAACRKMSGCGLPRATFKALKTRPSNSAVISRISSETASHCGVEDDAAGQSDEFCDELPHARNWCKILPEPCQGPDLPQFPE